MSDAHGQLLRRFMRRAVPASPQWICLAVSLLLAIGILAVLGVSWWSAILLVVLLACPVSVAWTLVVGHRPLPYPLGPVPVTAGRTLDQIAPYYDAVCRMVGLGRGFRRRTIALARLLPSERVLDAGCGTGVLTRLAASAVGLRGTAVGIDAAPDMIRVARERGAIARSRARFELAAVEDLPFADDSFDAVFASLLLHHLPADLKRKALREIHRVLKTGGRLIVVDLARPTSRLWRLLTLPLYRGLAMADEPQLAIPDLLGQAGFAPVLNLGRWGVAVRIWGAFKQQGGAPHG